MPKRYRVETLVRLCDEWRVEHLTDSLAVAEGYIAAMIKTHKVRFGRVVDEQTGLVVSQEPKGRRRSR
jgi:hypothetical protein